MSDDCCVVDHSQHEEFEKKTTVWDRVGMTLSSLCAVHCLLTPFLILLVPTLGGLFESEWVHLGLALLVMPVAFYAFWAGYQHHHRKYLLVMGFAGALMIGAASVLPHEWVEALGFDIMTIAGSFILVISHILNRKACLCHVHTVVKA